jgi:hypothetical protein
MLLTVADSHRPVDGTASVLIAGRVSSRPEPIPNHCSPRSWHLKDIRSVYYTLRREHGKTGQVYNIVGKANDISNRIHKYSVKRSKFCGGASS